MINRFVVLSTLILAFALAINWMLDESEKTEPDEPRNDPDLYMLNAAIHQYDQAGALQHTLEAARFTHFPLTDLTTMKSPSIALGKVETSPWRISADEGRLIPASDYREEIIELWNNVLAIHSETTARFINIQTESLTVYPEREYAETDRKVYIDNQNGRTTAAGMRAFLDRGRFMFYSTDTERVRTIFLPK